MLFNSSQINDEARRDEASKQHWEAQFYRAAVYFFQKIYAPKFAKYYETYGVILSPANLKEEYNKVMLPVYDGAANEFAMQIRSWLPAGFQKTQTGKAKAAVIDKDLKEFVDGAIWQSKDHIFETTLNDVARWANKTREDNPGISNKEIGIIVALRIMDSAPGRARTISVTETTSFGEEAKGIEAETLFGRDEGIKISGRMVHTRISKDGFVGKMWVAQLDRKTRDAHARADFQRVALSAKFYVWGEYMNHPGDKTAKKRNWIHCRCHAVYYLDNKNKNFTKPTVSYGEATVRSASYYAMQSKKTQAAVGFYTEEGEFINEAMRKGLPVYIETPLIKDFLKKAPKYQGTTYRGIRFGDKEELKEFMATVGDTFTDKAFLSASTIESEARAFMGKSKSVMLKVHSRKGFVMDTLSDKPGESEVLFNAGTRFKVLSTRTIPEGFEIELIDY